MKDKHKFKVGDMVILKHNRTIAGVVRELVPDESRYGFLFKMDTIFTYRASNKDANYAESYYRIYLPNLPKYFKEL